MKIMNLIIVAFLVVMFLISACSKEQNLDEKGDSTDKTNIPDIKGEEKDISEKDCGSDMACYVGSLKKCSPAKHYVSEGDQFAQMRVLGLDGTACKTEWKSNQGEMICKIPQSDLALVTEEDVNAGNIIGEICEGSLADALSSQLQIRS